MIPWEGKNILGVSGSIASYKIPILLMLLLGMQLEIKVLMSPSAKKFVRKNTLATLSKVPVWDSFRYGDRNWNNYVNLAFGQMHFLSLLLRPIFFAPAMDLDIYLASHYKREYRETP
ncbi:flavoprotein [Bacteroidetes bacterium endosymbiont of Geopemphigus sp.]|uniref:flavoprotein n=1 Tax=Bacteroidetes bacterium endosymbiont of Geopemphigus sp. TaxID=2047937 RepID=UPI001F4E55AA|nr:flavoprotein [Bacteroidetes bacterium endosymbiont of Geopemphigus sp.]